MHKTILDFSLHGTHVNFKGVVSDRHLKQNNNTLVADRVTVYIFNARVNFRKEYVVTSKPFSDDSSDVWFLSTNRLHVPILPQLGLAHDGGLRHGA